MHTYIVYVTAALVTAVTGAGVLAPRAAAESVATLPLIISAVQITGGVGKTGEDSIELYNPNPVPVNLNGMRLVKRSELGTTDVSIKSWTTDTMVPAYSFYLWASAAFTSIGVLPDITTSGTLSDNNGVALRVGAADAGVIVDSLSWGTTDNSFLTSGLPNPGAGQSIVRSTVFGDRAYTVTAHTPRNSSIQLLPEVPQIPPSVLVDNAMCVPETTVFAAEPGQVVTTNLTLTNTGTTSWTVQDYTVRQHGAGVDTAIGDSAILPNQQLTVVATVIAPVTEGSYLHEWSMSNAGVVFGASCAETITVSAPALPETPVIPPPASPTTIRITELLPNPTGTDTGQEQIELYNYGSETVNLNGWQIDDVAVGVPISSNSLVLSEQSVAAGMYATITVPPGSFSLNNTGGDIVTLYSSSDEQIDLVIYTGDAGEGKSYALLGLEWIWTATPSFGSVNIAPILEPEDEEEDTVPAPAPTPHSIINLEGLIISEIYASPALSTEQEFVELYNSTDKAISIGSGYLAVGARTVALPAMSIPAQQYFVLPQVPALANGGKTVEILTSDKVVIDSVTYPKLVKGSSYALLEDNFVVTFKPTPGASNVLQEEVITSKTQTTVTVKTVPKKQGAIAVTKTKTTTKVTAKKAEGDSVKAVVAKTTTTDKSKQLVDEQPAAAPNTKDVKNTSDAKPTSPVNAIALGLAVISTGAFAVYKLGVGGYF